jgi:hypothetical protein
VGKMQFLPYTTNRSTREITKRKTVPIGNKYGSEEKANKRGDTNSS